MANKDQGKRKKEMEAQRKKQMTRQAEGKLRSMSATKNNRRLRWSIILINGLRVNLLL